MENTSLYVTEEPGPISTEVDTCTLEMKKKYEVIPTVVCSVCLSFGLIYCFLGYRCFKMVMFLSGFMLGSAVVCLLYHREPALDTQLGLETKAGIGLGVGVLCGLVTMLLCALGLFVTGLQLGCLLTLAHLLVIGQFYKLNPAWAPLCAVLAASVACATLALRWQKAFTVASTAVFGATVVTLSVDYMVEGFTLMGHMHEILSRVPARPLCWFSWAVVGICPILCLMGVCVQWRITATGVYHPQVLHRKQQKKADLKYGYRRQRETYRRHRPPPLKRYAGDVLAPSYLQSLQERQMNTGSSTSSTVTRSIIDFDFETGSMAPLTASSPASRV